jgi:hypothetical protein
MSITLDMIFMLLTVLGIVGCLTFVSTYWIKTRGAWLKNEVGRFLVITYATLGSLFALIMVNRIFDQWPGRQIITITLFTAYVIFSWWPLRLLFRNQPTVKQNDRV